MEEDRVGRAQRVGQLTPDDIVRILNTNVHRREVVFVSGEPTLNPRFISYVRHARRLGYVRVGVITNGRRFAYAPFVVDAVKAGLNHVIVSIHGPDARVHDGLTRTPKSFEQALAALGHLSAARRQGLRLDTSTVLNRRNCKVEILERHVEMLLPLVDQMVFNVVQPFGRGKTHFDALVMRYSEVAEELGRFFLGQGGRSLPIFLVDIPYCTTEGRGIPDSARGYVERYCHYEVGGASGVGGVVSEAVADGGYVAGGAEAKRAAAVAGAQCGPEGLVAKARDDQESSQKVKMESCRLCVYDGICDGVWANYVERYGFEEFVPVRRG